MESEVPGDRLCLWVWEVSLWFPAQGSAVGFLKSPRGGEPWGLVPRPGGSVPQATPRELALQLQGN